MKFLNTYINLFVYFKMKIRARKERIYKVSNAHQHAAK